MSNQQRPYIDIRNVSFGYTNSSVASATIESITMAIEKGSFISIVGPSGCGKTTLLRLITGLISQTTGSILIDGLSPDQARKDRLIGYVFQQPVLFDWRTVRQNVELPGEGSLEDFLLETLHRRLGLGPLKFLKKKENVLSEAGVAAICETLGTIGTNKSCGILQKLEKQHDSLWKNKAEEALEKIAEREESENSIETA